MNYNFYWVRNWNNRVLTKTVVSVPTFKKNEIFMLGVFF